MEQLFQLSSVGLMYDGIGVVVLGFAFFLKSVKAMIVETGTYWGGNDALLESLIQQRTDGVAGTAFLVVGFLLQLIGSLGIRYDLAGEILFVLLVGASVAYPLFLRKKLISLQVLRGTTLRQQELEQK